MSTHITVRDDVEVERAWRTLMEPLGFAGRSLWMMLVADELTKPQLIEFDELPEVPETADVAGFAHILGHLAHDPNAFRVAFLLSRPGVGGPTPADRRWAAALGEAVARAGMPAFVTHLATDTDLVPLPADDAPAT